MEHADRVDRQVRPEAGAERRQGDRAQEPVERAGVGRRPPIVGPEAAEAPERALRDEHTARASQAADHDQLADSGEPGDDEHERIDEDADGRLGELDEHGHR